MMTICVNVEPYLAHYMYARYANCIREGAIKLSHRTNLYHIFTRTYRSPTSKYFLARHRKPHFCPTRTRHRQRSAYLQLPERRKHPPAFREDKPPDETGNDRIYAQREI